MILIGLGSNIKKNESMSLIDSLNLAINDIEKIPVKILKKSSFYSSAPVPMSDQPWYVNAVISIETSIKPIDLLNCLHRVERDFGRERGEKWAPRTLDLDLLSYNALKLNSKIKIPHPRLHERAFVLYPLRDVNQNWIHPILSETVNQMIDKLPYDQLIEKIEEK